MALEDEDLPVLNDVVRSGNESIIQSTRLERVGIKHLDADSTAPLHFELPAHLQIDSHAYDMDLDEAQDLDQHEDTCFELQQRDLESSFSSRWNNPSISEGLLTLKNSISSNDSLTPEDSSDEQLELLIDEIIDRHIESLRTDLRKILRHARELP